MTEYVQTREDLLTHLREQINFMIASAVSFDNGFEGEAKRLAVAIRILVHDTSSSEALLTLLRKKDVLYYDSASSFDPRNLLPSNCLTMIRASRKEDEELMGDYVAPLERLSPARNKNKKVGFGRWWNRTTMYKDKEGNSFTRRDLVLAVANKEGGAHIDRKLDQAYANLARFNSLGWKVFTEVEEKDFRNSPILPSIRQIAHEILKTLSDEVVSLFPESDLVFQRLDGYKQHCTALSQ
ncbi:MAG: hypothetical protein Q8P44_04650 [Dehalococcoidia bacterium]|nr:hypothetical protein [Dehalococcoidia bacterium]